MWQAIFSDRFFQKQVDEHGKLFRDPVCTPPSDPPGGGGKVSGGAEHLLACQPGAARGRELKP